jgi:ferric-dicitrate binding protein FerR (iron transport regulator)
MNDERGDELRPGTAGALMSRAERQAEALVRGLSTPAADAGFRDRLRAAFTAGAVTPGRASTDPAARSPGGAGNRSRRGRWLAAAGAAAAILAIVVFLRPGGSARQEWTVVTITGAGEEAIRVDGRPVAVADLTAGRFRLRGGARIALPESVAIELRWAGLLALETVAGTSFSLPGGPSRGADGSLVGRIEEGEVRFVTAPAFSGRGLRIESEEASVEVTGTTFSVIRDSLGTCVCVEEGAVRLTARDGTGSWHVPAGRRRQHYGGGRPSEELDLRPGESMKLRMLQERTLPELR